MYQIKQYVYSNSIKPNFRCVIHGSFSKHFAEIKLVREVFEAAGIEVLAPKPGKLVGSKDGFALFGDEGRQDPRMIELLYLHHLKKLDQNGFSYFVNSDGYIGKSASYELAVAQLTNTRFLFSDKLHDHPAYQHAGSIMSAKMLVNYIVTNKSFPRPKTCQNERKIHQLWENLMVSGSVVAAGAIIEHQPTTRHKDKEIRVTWRLSDARPCLGAF